MSEGRYVVTWDEKLNDMFGDLHWYNHHEDKFSNEKDAVELFNKLSNCEKEGSVKNVSLFDKLTNKYTEK